MTAAAAGPPAFTMIPVGINREPEPVYDAHTAPQRRFVGNIVALPEFDYACDNPFTLEQKAHHYRGPFWFLWYDISGQMHAVKVGVLGRMLLEITPDASPTPDRDDTDPIRVF